MTTPHHSSPDVELDRSRRLRIITGGILASFLAALDTTALATVMPTIAGDLGGLSLYSWVFAVYMIMSAVTMPLWGKLSDIFGKKLLFFLTVAVFLSGSVLCGAAQSMTQLIVFRGVQGIGAGGLSSIPFAMVSTVFPSHERGKALGVVASAWGISSILGPMLGSLIVLSLHWRWVFFINLPIGAAAVYFIARHFLEHAPHQRQRIDYTGAALLCLAILATLVAFKQFGHGEALLSVDFFALAGCALVLIGLFFWQEERAEHPIIALHFFRQRAFWVGNLLGFLASSGMYGIIAFLPLYVQTMKGGSALDAGLVITPMSLGWSMASVTAGRLAHRAGEARLIRLGILLMLTGCGLMLAAGLRSDTWFLILCVTITGIGMGCQTPSLTLTVQQSLGPHHIGIATSTQMLSRTIGGALGVSIMGTGLVRTMNQRLASLLPAGSLLPAADPQKLLEPRMQSLLSPEQLNALLTSFSDGMQVVFGIALVMICLSFIFSFLLPRASHSPAA